jgi:large subunit ribosomal protein L21
MYAVIKTGGKQYRVQPGDKVRIEKLAGEVGAKVKFDTVLMIAGEGEPNIGRPTVDKASCEAEIVRQAKGEKVLHFHKNYFGYTRRRGHRQLFTEVKITKIRA